MKTAFEEVMDIRGKGLPEDGEVVRMITGDSYSVRVR